MTAHIDVDRARYLMDRQNLDALLVCTPENFYYSTGYSSMLVWLYRQAALGLALIPARGDVAPAAFLPAPDAAQACRSSGFDDVHGIPVWFETYAAVSPQDQRALLARERPLLPEQYDRTATCREVAGTLRDRGLWRGRIGIEKDFVDANTLALLQKESPQAEFVDSTPLLYELRAIKNHMEVTSLRQAAAITAAGIVAAGQSIARDSTVPSVTEAFVSGVWAAARRLNAADSLGAMDGQPGFGFPAGRRVTDGCLPDGTTVKFDVQVAVSHYHSDLGRTYAVGQPSADVLRIHQTLAEAQARARDTLQPGRPICEVFNAVRDVLRPAGLAGHNRGHYGHSVGLDAKIEEPPFISAVETRPLSAGMVLAVEAPFYMNGVGLFQIEDMCLITDNGYELLDRLPYGLQIIGK